MSGQQISLFDRAVQPALNVTVAPIDPRIGLPYPCCHEGCEAWATELVSAGEYEVPYCRKHAPRRAG